MDVLDGQSADFPVGIGMARSVAVDNLSLFIPKKKLEIQNYKMKKL